MPRVCFITAGSVALTASNRQLGRTGGCVHGVLIYGLHTVVPRESFESCCIQLNINDGQSTHCSSFKAYNFRGNFKRRHILISAMGQWHTCQPTEKNYRQ